MYCLPNIALLIIYSLDEMHPKQKEKTGTLHRILFCQSLFTIIVSDLTVSNTIPLFAASYHPMHPIIVLYNLGPQKSSHKNNDLTKPTIKIKIETRGLRLITQNNCLKGGDLGIVTNRAQVTPRNLF